MKLHSLANIKQQARAGHIDAIAQNGTTSARVRGAVVQVEHAAIVAMYVEATDTYLWNIAGDFATEADVLQYVHNPADFDGPVTVSPELALKKFDAWREKQIPQLIAKAVGHEQKYQTLFWTDNQWNILWSGPEGYLRIMDMTKVANGDPTRSKFLAEKRKIAEKALFDTSERFLAEFKRLEMTPVAA